MGLTGGHDRTHAQRLDTGTAQKQKDVNSAATGLKPTASAAAIAQALCIRVKPVLHSKDQAY